jgi:hypothetical protein
MGAGREDGLGSEVVKLVNAELNAIAWPLVRCACERDASHLPELVRAALQSGERDALERSLNGHAMISSFIYEPAVPLTSVLLAALADDIGPESRVGALEMIQFFVSPDGQSFDAERAGRDFIEECNEEARKGTWLLYQQVFSGRDILATSSAFEILTIIETDTRRLVSVHDAAGTLLPRHLRDWKPED